MTDNKSVSQKQDQKYIIPKIVLERYPELVEMLKKSESIDDDEKNYWFGALETMDEDQVKSLREILEDEISQLKKIEEEGHKEAIQEIDKVKNEMIEKQIMEDRKKAEEERREKEAKIRKEEEDRQDELLSMLDNI